MKSGDNSEEPKITEGKWCDHVNAHGEWLKGATKPTIVVISPRVRIVIEEGTVKILCLPCYLEAIQPPLIPRA